MVFLRAHDRIVDSDPMDQVEFVVITARVRVSGLDNGEHPSDVNAFDTKLLCELAAQRDHRRFAMLDVAARKKNHDSPAGWANSSLEPSEMTALTISSISGDVTTEP